MTIFPTGRNVCRSLKILSVLIRLSFLQIPPISYLADVNLFSGRLHAVLLNFLPASLLPLLPPPHSPRVAILDALSSGQLLCIAYNAGVRRSRKPWGYINKDAVHDIAAIEAKAAAEEAAEGGKDGDAAEKRKKGWTFRRTDNLRLWAG